MSSIAILIDCWPGTNSDEIKNIKQYCVDNTSIKTIVLSSYNSHYGVSLHQPYWNNSNELFNSNSTLGAYLMSRLKMVRIISNDLQNLDWYFKFTDNIFDPLAAKSWGGYSRDLYRDGV